MAGRGLLRQVCRRRKWLEGFLARHDSESVLHLRLADFLPRPPPRQGPAGTPPADGVRGEDGGVCGGRTVRLLDDEVRGWVKAAEGGGGGREGRDVYQDGGSRAGIPHRAATCSHVCMCAHCTRVRDEVLCMCPRFYTCRPPSSAYLRESQEQGIF